MRGILYTTPEAPVARAVAGVCLALIGLSVAILLLPGCNAPPRQVGTLAVALEAMPTQLDPRLATDAHSSRIASLLFASLLRRDAGGRAVAWLASSWQADDQLTWRFSLRSDFVFHDRRPVTADDVVASYRALMDPVLGSPRKAMLASVQSIEKTGPYEVVFKLSQPDAAFLEAASFAVLPSDLAAERHLSSEQLIGAGPYRLLEVRHGDRVLLEAHGDYADGYPPIERIEFRVIPDETMRALELQHGSVDLVQNALDPDTVSWLKKNAGHLEIRRSPSNSFQYLGLNLDHPALADKRVRRALAMAIDRQAIVDYLLAGRARVASGLLPPQHWAHHDGGPAIVYAPDQAGRLLDRAGYPRRGPDGTRLTLDYKTTTQQLRRRLAEAIAAQLSALGVKLKLSSWEWGTFYSDIKKGNFDSYSLAWVGILDPDILRNVFHSGMTPPLGANRGRFADRRVDRLTDKALLTETVQQRARLYARVQKRLAALLPVIPLWWPENVVVTSRRLKGFTPHPSGDLLGLASAELLEKPPPVDTSPEGRAARDPLR